MFDGFMPNLKHGHIIMDDMFFDLETKDKEEEVVAALL